MRSLTDCDMAEVIGSTVKGYRVEDVRIKRGTFTDSDQHGIILGRSAGGHYVTWQFHYDEDEKISVYWGHYFMENREAAIRDFKNRDLDSSVTEKNARTPVSWLYEVTIIETLKLTVEVEAPDQQKAEEIISDDYRAGKHIPTAEDFHGVEFCAIPINEQQD